MSGQNLNLTNAKLRPVDGLTVKTYYNVYNESLINYLLDYSTFLIKNKFYDKKILNWQIENISLFKSIEDSKENEVNNN
jgi:hypothetical protein